MHDFISNALNHLPGPVTPEQWIFWDETMNIECKSIARNEYATVLDEVVRLMDDTYAIDPNIVRLFSIDYNADFVATSLTKILSKSSATKFHILIRILEQCLRKDTWLVSAIIDLSRTDNERQSEIVQLLVSTPSRVANHFEGKIPDTFMIEIFCAILSLALIRALHFASEMNFHENSDIFNCKFIACLFGRMTIDFNVNRTSNALPKVIAVLAEWSTCEKYRSMIQQLMLMLPRNSIEQIALYVLETDQPDHILGDAVNLSEDWAHILQSKLPLMMHIKNNRVIKNLIEYLASRLQGDAHTKTITDFARCWASENSIKFQTLDEHIQLTKLVVLGAQRFHVKETPDAKLEIESSIHRGVQSHMKSLQSTIRALGMVTAEIVMNHLDGIGTELHFEYDTFTVDEKRLIAELMTFSKWSPPTQKIDIDGIVEQIVNMSKPEICEMLKSNIAQPSKTMEVEASLTTVSTMGITTLAQPMECDEIDSDDDLQPFDLSNDQPLVEDKAPRYLIDLRNALQDTDDPDVFQQSMTTAASLIAEKLPHDITDIGIHLLQLFIRLDKKFYMENFEQHRLSACVAICCARPKESAEYLCREFHSEVGHLSIAAKVFILNILDTTAKELSKLSPTDTVKDQPTKKKPTGKLLEIDAPQNTLAEAKRVINARIQAKVKRLTSATTPAYRNEQVNRFANVAGDFFFPLVSGVSGQHATLSRHWLKHDTDNILLTNFLDTVATITLAAQNCPIVTKIAPEIFELSSALRFHPEAKVRESVLKIIAAALMITPPYILQMHCASHLVELRLWLEQCLSSNVIRGGETDADCREFAKHVYALCVDVMSQ